VLFSETDAGSFDVRFVPRRRGEPDGAGSIDQREGWHTDRAIPSLKPPLGCDTNSEI
jgi:hypothetical protein